MAMYNRLSEAMFMKAKALLNAGKTPLEVANFCGMARTTATRIKNTATYEDYLNDISERCNKEKAPAEGKKITRTKITQNIYNAVKLILKGGSGIKEAADVMGISVNSVRRIGKSENYVEYVNIAYMNGAMRYKTPKEEAPKAVEPTPQTVEPETAEGQQIPRKQTIIVQTTWQMTQEMKRQNELLEGISNKLACIVQDLYGVNTDAKPDH